MMNVVVLRLRFRYAAAATIVRGDDACRRAQRRARHLEPRTLTRLGGGAFGNDDGWFDDAMLRALQIVGDRDRNVVIVSYGRASASLRSFVQQSGLPVG